MPPIRPPAAPFFSRALVAALAVAVASAQAAGEPVPAAVRALGKAIASYQRQVVWTGGDQYSGAYTDADRQTFLRGDHLSRIVRSARKNSRFVRGAKALADLSPDERQALLDRWRTPIDRTWAQTGRIGVGTTEAGQETESDIAEALVALADEVLAKHLEEIAAKSAPAGAPDAGADGPSHR